MCTDGLYLLSLCITHLSLDSRFIVHFACVEIIGHQSQGHWINSNLQVFPYSITFLLPFRTSLESLIIRAASFLIHQQYFASLRTDSHVDFICSSLCSVLGSKSNFLTRGQMIDPFCVALKLVLITNLWIFSPFLSLTKIALVGRRWKTNVLYFTHSQTYNTLYV